jgi:hypothetical protein
MKKKLAIITTREADDYRRTIREGNADAVGAAAALFAVMIVGGFLFFGLKMSESEGFKAASGYGVSSFITGAPAPR